MRRALMAALLACTFPGVAWSAAPTTAQTASSAKTEANTEAEDEISAEDREQFDAYQRYQAHFKEQLRTSANPRDWALAAQTFVFLESDDQNDDRDTLMRNAASAAPTDVLVQWWAGNWREHTGKACSQALPRPEIVAALQAMDADNGAVWMLGLDAAMQAKDEAAVDRVLIQMAAAKRFDTHIVDTFQAWSSAYERFGLPQWPQPAAGSGDEVPASASLQRYVLAMSLTAATMPGYYRLNRACKVTADHAGEQLHRASLCEEAGRHMSAVSQSMADASIGLAIVRAAGREQAQDLQRRRELAWLQSSLAQQAVAVDFDAYVSDLLSTRDELEAHRRALQRAQLEEQASAWWQPALEAITDGKGE